VDGLQGGTFSGETALKYSHRYRNPGAATLPSRLAFDLVEVPWDMAHLRMDLPKGDRRFGVFTTERPLTEDELRTYEIDCV
jgi:hypothetical protein